MRMFANREEAARELAGALSYLKGQDVVVVSVSNGGLPIALRVCEVLDAPLDMLVLARLAAPRNKEHIVGAVDEHGRISLIEQTARWHHLTTHKMIGPAREAFRGLERRRARIRNLLPEQEVRGKTAVVVADGVTDGASMLAAIASVKSRGAKRVVAAAPAGQQKAIWALHDAADTVVIPHTPSKFRGVDKFYKEFPEITDTHALDLIREHISDRGLTVRQVRSMAMNFITDGGERSIYSEVEIPEGEGPFPAVIFAHGFESHCRSPRTLPISFRLAKRGIIGVRIDFQGHGRSDGTREACTHDNMVDDLRTVFENLTYDARIKPEQIAIIGSGTGAMVALDFAAQDDRVATLVVRGPICGGEANAAADVKCPTLIIHAEADESLARDVERINELLPSTHFLLRIPECNRLFNDPISMELMINASVDWLDDHLKVAGVNAQKRRRPHGTHDDRNTSETSASAADG